MILKEIPKKDNNKGFTQTFTGIPILNNELEDEVIKIIYSNGSETCI